jgi:hypothetical protein
MKKLLIAIMAICFTGIGVAFADGTKTCKVNGTTGSVEVSVYTGDTEKGTASMSFSNDTDVDVNVRYTITFSGVKNADETKANDVVRSGSKRVAPHSEGAVDIAIGKTYTDVTVTSATGEKCN